MLKGIILLNIDNILYAIAMFIAGKNHTLRLFALIGGALALIINLIRGKYFQE